MTGKQRLAYTICVEKIFEALCASTRRAILDELHDRDGQTLFELCTRLISRTGESLTRQAISQHLEILESAGLIATKRESRYKFHYLISDPLEAIVNRWANKKQRSQTMKIAVTSIFVDDQDKALNFYTNTLGFLKKTEVPLGKDKWLTVVSQSEPNGVELLLEPSGHPAVNPYRRALVEDGIPLASFAVGNVQAEYERLSALGVNFTQLPLDMGNVVTAVFDDTCGNLIQIAQMK